MINKKEKSKKKKPPEINPRMNNPLSEEAFFNLNAAYPIH